MQLKCSEAVRVQCNNQHHPIQIFVLILRKRLRTSHDLDIGINTAEIYVHLKERNVLLAHLESISIVLWKFSNCFYK